MNDSKLWSLTSGDWIRGLIVAVITTPLTIIYQSLTVTPITFIFDWKTILATALAGGAAYILKNLGTGIEGRLLTNDSQPVK